MNLGNTPRPTQEFNIPRHMYNTTQDKEEWIESFLLQHNSKNLVTALPDDVTKSFCVASFRKQLESYSSKAFPP